jgi:oxalate decarboxylase
MKHIQSWTVALLCAGLASAAPKAPPQPGQPISADGKGAPLLGNELPQIISEAVDKSLTIAITGGTNKQLDLQNPDNLRQQSTDNGVVPNLKWSFSDSHTRLLKGGWVREQVVTDLPASPDISAAQQHLKKGAIRELHWHRVVRSDEIN